MRRDMETVRTILRSIEDSPDAVVEVPRAGFAGIESGSLEAHVRLILEAGLAESLMATRERWLLRLTWVGHDFVEHARSNTRWNSALRLLAESGKAVTLGALSSLLESIAKRELKDLMASQGLV